MRRTMNFDTLADYLSSAHMTVMLCRAHAERFALSDEDVLDAEWRIGRHIVELESLIADIRHNCIDRLPENVVRLITKAAGASRQAGAARTSSGAWRVMPQTEPPAPSSET